MKSSFFKASIATVLTLFWVYFISELHDMRLHYDAPASALTNLFYIKTFLILSMFLSLYVALSIYLKSKILYISSVILAFIFTYFTYFPPFIQDYNYPLSPVYILLGDRLRDIYGINWYWMDWFNWMFNFFFYLMAIYYSLSALLLKMTSRFFKLNKQFFINFVLIFYKKL